MLQQLNNHKKIRILIVDDSAVVRRILSTVISDQTDMEVVGTATNGLLGIEFIRKQVPDLVILDIEMPVMDGISALKEIRKFNSHLPIIIFSSLTQKGALVTIDALTNGASDYQSKPSNISDFESALIEIRENLIPKIRTLCAPNIVATRDLLSRSDVKIPFAKHHQTTLTKGKIEAVCIGVSTGGPAALMYMFEEWKNPLTVPVLIVQHMPPKFTEFLAKRLSDIGVIPVEEPYDGQEVLPGKAYIAPGGMHMGVNRVGKNVYIELNDGPLENSCRPAVDVLFRTAANTYGPNLLAVVLTGMGSDGLKGAVEIHHHHGRIIAQDEESSVVWGMPRAVVNANLAEKILPLKDIPSEILRQVLSL